MSKVYNLVGQPSYNIFVWESVLTQYLLLMSSLIYQIVINQIGVCFEHLNFYFMKTAKIPVYGNIMVYGNNWAVFL